jgi:hypothetical protein
MRTDEQTEMKRVVVIEILRMHKNALYRIYVEGNNKNIFKMFLVYSVKCPIFLSYLNYKWNLSTNFYKNLPISNFTEIRSVAAERRKN